MTDIPADIMKVAETAYRKSGIVVREESAAYITHIIASTIMDERDRCARMAAAAFDESSMSPITEAQAIRRASAALRRG